MPAPTLAQLFGQNSVLTTDVGGDAIATIYLKDFATEGLAIPATLSELKASQLAAALLIKWLLASTGNEEDPTWGVTVGGARPALTTRGESSQRQLGLDAYIYTPDNTPLIPDPDAVI